MMMNPGPSAIFMESWALVSLLIDSASDSRADCSCLLPCNKASCSLTDLEIVWVLFLVHDTERK
eukprot:300676-Karenia_brevis.AAC.1